LEEIAFDYGLYFLFAFQLVGIAIIIFLFVRARSIGHMGHLITDWYGEASKFRKLRPSSGAFANLRVGSDSIEILVAGEVRHTFTKEEITRICKGKRYTFHLWFFFPILFEIKPANNNSLKRCVFCFYWGDSIIEKMLEFGYDVKLVCEGE